MNKIMQRHLTVLHRKIQARHAIVLDLRSQVPPLDDGTSPFTPLLPPIKGRPIHVVATAPAEADLRMLKEPAPPSYSSGSPLDEPQAGVSSQPAYSSGSLPGEPKGNIPMDQRSAVPSAPPAICVAPSAPPAIDMVPSAPPPDGSADYPLQ